MAQPTQGGLLTSAQAGRLLGVSARTVVRMAQRGEIDVAHILPGPHGAYLFQTEVVQQKALELLVGAPEPIELDLGLPSTKRAS